MEITIVQKQTIRFAANRLDISEEALSHRAMQASGQPHLDRLTMQQADDVKRALQNEYAEALPSITRMRSKAIHLASQSFRWVLTPGNADWTRFNNWMKSHSTAKKRLNDCSVKELVALVSQLERVHAKASAAGAELKDYIYHE